LFLLCDLVFVVNQYRGLAGGGGAGQAVGVNHLSTNLKRANTAPFCRFISVGLFLPVLVLAQVQTPATPAEIERAQTVELNGLIAQTNAAAQAKDWPQAKDLAGKLIAANDRLAAAYPDNPSFPGAEPEYYKLLGDAHLNLREYKDAIAVDQKSATLNQALRDDGKDSPELRKTMGAALTLEGNAWLKLGNNKEAIACYEKAAAFDSHPATAWFNICAVEYNAGNMNDAVAAADRCIALDPTKADAYFIKGSCLFGNGTVDASGKFVVSAEAMVALRKYLELAPNGNHADDVKQMLEATGVIVK
jgi:tetratricopeptide (TPR) repeat protein